MGQGPQSDTHFQAWLKAVSQQDAPTTLLAHELEECEKIASAMGQEGALLQEAFRESQCGETIATDLDKDSSEAAHFRLFDVEGNFLNRIDYNPELIIAGENFFTVRAHEQIHALQATIAACLYADPHNRNTDIVLAPLDAALMLELIERDAYAKGAYYTARHKDMTGSAHALSKVDQLILSNPDRALVFHAQGNLQSARPANGKASNLLEYVREAAIASYEAAVLRRIKEGTLETLSVARLGPEDIVDCGRSLGLSLFESEPGLPSFSTKTMPLSTAHAARFVALNRALNLDSGDGYDRLPTLEEALQAKGMTKESWFTTFREQAEPQKSPKTGPFGVNNPLRPL